MVEDDVHAHAQSCGVERLDHAAELHHARHAVVDRRGIAALGRVEVVRVVAPVEAVGGLRRGDGRLLRLAIRRAAGRRRDAARLRHAGEVEHRHQVDIGQARGGQCGQVLHPVRAGVGERQVLAAVRRRHGRIVGREVAQVQLVDRLVGGAGHGCRRRAGVPAARLGAGVVQADGLAARAAGSQRQRIRIGDEVAHEADAAHEHLDAEAVVAAAGVGRDRDAPDAGGGVERHRIGVGGVRRAARVAVQHHALRGRRPQLVRGGAGRDRRPQRRRGRRGVEVVERARDLGRRRVLRVAADVLLHDHDLRLVQRGQPWDVGVAHVVDAAGADPLEARGNVRGNRAAVVVQRDRAVGAADGRAQRGDDLPGVRPVQLDRAAARSRGPLHELARQPHGALVGRGHRARVGHARVDGRVALHQPDLADPVADREVGVGDDDVVGAAVLVVDIGRHAVDDELQRVRARRRRWIDHRDVERDLGGRERVVGHRAERRRVVPVAEDDAAHARGVQPAAAPQVQAPGRVVVGVAQVVHAHGVDVGRRRAVGIAGVDGQVVLDAPDLVGARLQRVALVGAAVVLSVAVVEDVAHAARGGGQPGVEVHAEGVRAVGIPAVGPGGRTGGAPGVHLPAGIVAVGALVVDAQRRGAGPAARRRGRDRRRHGVEHETQGGGVAVGQVRIDRSRGRDGRRGAAVVAAASGQHEGRDGPEKCMAQAAPCCHPTCVHDVSVVLPEPCATGTIPVWRHRSEAKLH